MKDNWNKFHFRGSQVVLDTQTILFLWTPIAIFSALVVLLFRKTAPDVRGSTVWAVATLCFGATGFLFSARSAQAGLSPLYTFDSEKEL